MAKRAIKNKITVLELINSFHRGGAELLALNLARYIDKSKFNVIVCSVVKDDMSFIDISEYESTKLISFSRSAHSGRLKGILELCRIVKENKVDIIHTHCQSPDFYGRIVGLIMRIPVISTNTGGIPELIGDGSGIMVNQKDPIALADAIEKLMKDSEYYKTIAKKGRKKVEDEFNVNKIAQELLNLFEDNKKVN